MENNALAELVKQAELALLAFNNADKHLEGLDASYLNPDTPSVMIIKLCVNAAALPLLKLVTGLYAVLGVDLVRAMDADGQRHSLLQGLPLSAWNIT